MTEIPAESGSLGEWAGPSLGDETLAGASTWVGNALVQTHVGLKPVPWRRLGACEDSYPMRPGEQEG